MTQHQAQLEQVHFSVKQHFWSRTKPILRGVDLKIAKGEILGFLGPNGAGKTTSIKCLLGLLQPSSGSVQVLGGSIRDPSIRQRIGFMPERSYFPEYIKGRELLWQHGMLAGMSWSLTRTRAEAVLEQVGLHHAANERLGGYSKGMLQRVGIAQALIGDPELIVLDEPMSGLDPIGRRDIRQIMLNLRTAGKTVFFSTHILPDVEMICDRVSIMMHGQIRRTGPLSALLTEVGGLDVVADGCDKEIIATVTSMVSNVEQIGSSTRFITEGETEGNLLLDALRSAGARIKLVQPHRRGLEELFLEEFSEDNK